MRKGYFVWKKEIFVRKGKIENGQRTKKDETEKRRKTKGVSQRCEQRMKKTTKRNTKILQKRRDNFFEKKKCQARKRVKMRRVDRESEHQEGTHKERKHEKCQNKEKKERET